MAVTDYTARMSIVWNEARIQSYIDGKIEENLNLDYKGAGALARTPQALADISKHISAFANSAGGLVIYGIKEFDAKDKKHLPEKIDPIDRRKFSREWLEQIIADIQPRPTVLIHSVQLQSNPDHVVYVVEIPPGTTAHQAADLKYYKRYNFQAVPMQDFEIRDIMRRKTHPSVKTTITILLGKQNLKNSVLWRIDNESDVLARHVSTTIYVPAKIEGAFVRFKEFPQHVDEEGHASWAVTPFNPLDRPLFPRSIMQAEIEFDFVTVTGYKGIPLKTRDEILFKTYADEMPPVSGRLPLKEAIRQRRAIR